jgi:capsular exopolysaccharide synthesis family protein
MGFQVVPNFLYCLALGAVVGTVLGGAGAWYLDSLDQSFQTPEQIRAEVGSPILAHIPLIQRKDRKKSVADSPLQPVLAAYHFPRSRAAEAYRAARTAILFGIEDGKVIQVTSPGPGDGKSTTCANIGIAMAKAGKKVLLIDADLRRPQLHKLFGLNPCVGFASVIADAVELTDGICSTAVNNLFVLPCGPRPKDPAELLSSPRVEEIIDGLREKFDIILVDSPPLLAVTDASILATVVDRVLLTLRITRDGRHAVPMAVNVLRQMEAKVLGVIVNGVVQQEGSGYSGAGKYSYSYGRYGRGTYAYEYGAYFKDTAPEPTAEDPAQAAST